MPNNMEDEDEDDSEELSFWDECARVAKKNPAPQRGGAAPLGPSGRAPAAGTTASKKKVNKEEVHVSVCVHCFAHTFHCACFKHILLASFPVPAQLLSLVVWKCGWALFSCKCDMIVKG